MAGVTGLYCLSDPWPPGKPCRHYSFLVCCIPSPVIGTLPRIMEGREFMNVDMIDVLTPTDRGGCPQLPLKVELAQVELDNRRAVFNRRADKGLLIPLRDSRLKLHLHSHRHPTPSATTDVLMDTWQRG